MIFHSYSLPGPLNADIVALSLFQMFNQKTGRIRFQSRQQVVEHFKLRDDVTIILSGTQEDYLIERWWNPADREGVIHALRDLALVWSEIQREGIPCALHLNARTERGVRALDAVSARPRGDHECCF